MAKSCGHANNEIINKCRICYLYKTDTKYKAYYDGTKPLPEAKSPLSCIYLGKRVRNEDSSIKKVKCTTGCAKGTLLDVFECEMYGETTLSNCFKCNSRVEKQVIKSPKKQIVQNDLHKNIRHLWGKESLGVVIGTKDWPNLIELQINIIRYNCGKHIPILIADDCSQGCEYNPDPKSNYAKLLSLTKKYPQVDIVANPVTFGHGAGDLSVFHKGLTWAKNKNLKYLVKISRRMIIDIPFWIQFWLYRLMKDCNVVAAKHRRQLPNWPIHTSLMFLDVHAWNTILHKLQPLALKSWERNLFVEGIIKDIIEKDFNGKLTPINIISNNPKDHNPGVLWHESNTIEDYKKVFSKYNLNIDEDFCCLPSGLLKDFKIG